MSRFLDPILWRSDIVMLWAPLCTQELCYVFFPALDVVPFVHIFRTWTQINANGVICNFIPYFYRNTRNVHTWMRISNNSSLRHLGGVGSSIKVAWMKILWIEYKKLSTDTFVFYLTFITPVRFSAQFSTKFNYIPGNSVYIVYM